MPIYEYKCEACGHVFENYCRKIEDETVSKCPECGNEAKRLISCGGFIINGFNSSNKYSSNSK